MRRAFTLIELLIVVAIIAILAMIAVPNFLEAQTRSKIARGKADMRTIQTAVEAYYVDNNVYPSPSHRGPDLLYDCPELSTPIAYLSNVRLTDPFGSANRWGDNAGGGSFPSQWGVGYKYFFLDSDDGVNNGSTWAERASLPAANRCNAYLLYSYGPDFAQNILEWFAVGLRNCDALYDPTNGTVSQGDFGKYGGDARSFEAAMINR
jgi:prepilin-type N-terminal cleavage/methylation domain-containing protein